jgi:hypothetical protein
MQRRAYSFSRGHRIPSRQQVSLDGILEAAELVGHCQVLPAQRAGEGKQEAKAAGGGAVLT